MNNKIVVDVESTYQQDQSSPSEQHFVFTYTIRISNQGDNPAQLISRHWYIEDAENATQEVEGLGVIGEQPKIQPGSSYSYTSGVVLKTPTGTMNGTYTMEDEGGESFEATIPTFALIQPGSLH